MRNGKKGLTPRQSKFVDKYLATLDAVAAYRAAGYKARTYSGVRACASEILASTNVQAALRERAKKIEQRTEITQDRVRLELGRVAFFDPRRLFDQESGKLIDVVNLPGEVAAAISAIEVTSNKDGERVTKLRLCSKTEALDKLCRHLRMYAEPPAPVVNVQVNVDMRGEWSDIIRSSRGDRKLSGAARDPVE